MVLVGTSEIYLRLFAQFKGNYSSFTLELFTDGNSQSTPVSIFLESQDSQVPFPILSVNGFSGMPLQGRGGGWPSGSRKDKRFEFPALLIASPYWLARRAWVGEEDVLGFLGKTLSKKPDSKNNLQRQKMP